MLLKFIYNLWADIFDKLYRNITFCILSFGRFPDVRILCANVSEHSGSPIFTGVVIIPTYTAYEDGKFFSSSCLHHLYRSKRQSVLNLWQKNKFRRQRITPK
jgi:hypothetical protein